MKKSNKFSPEVRERAVRMVQEHRGEYPSLWAAIESIAPKIGCVPQTLNEWVKRVEVDTGVRDGVLAAQGDPNTRVRPLCQSKREPCNSLITEAVKLWITDSSFAVGNGAPTLNDADHTTLLKGLSKSETSTHSEC